MKDLKTQELLSLVDKYTKNLPTFDGTKVRRSEIKGDVVLVTGSTGSLGSNILAHLLRDPNVSRIYSISRPGADKQTAKERHIKSFEREAIDLKLLDSEKVQFLIGDPSKHSFDIDTNLYNEVRGSCPSIQSSSNPRLTTLLPEDARNSDTCYSQW